MRFAYPAPAPQPEFADHIDREFARAVISGLSGAEKSLPSKFLYDERGSELFDRITELPEYYLYRAEKNIIEHQAQHFFEHLEKSPLDVIELGSGNGEKTTALLQAMLNEGQQVCYHHIDISDSSVDGLTKKLQSRFPKISVNGIHADYHSLLGRISDIGEQEHKAVLFLGSNIGNYDQESSNRLLSELHSGLNAGDNLLIGFDLRKDYQRMIDAYNDKKGVTAEFNLNALQRMNRELGSNFNLDHFYHYEIFNPLKSAMQSFLVSKADQTVHFAEIDFTISLATDEAIYMESSRKYTLADIEKLAADNGFKVMKNFSDDNGDFVDSLWQRA